MENIKKTKEEIISEYMSYLAKRGHMKKPRTKEQMDRARRNSIITRQLKAKKNV